MPKERRMEKNSGRRRRKMRKMRRRVETLRKR
jgi:hypothetical protein